MSWIDSRGATLAALAEQGKLWVMQETPPKGRGYVSSWVIQAREGDRSIDVIKRWMLEMRMPLPRSHTQCINELMNQLAHIKQVCLVIQDADVLRGSVLNSLRLLTENRMCLVLVGDVCQINVATQKFPSFYQRAAYCVPVSQVFNGPVSAAPSHIHRSDV